ncbi:MAG TPA: cysteine desulfurase-like protein [Terriglobales bacterium]|jgi:cysteine desulfurase family protein (TIGR01976 family)|nr:cysteine desulfurase-like protein [Terriglobales bacterium]
MPTAEQAASTALDLTWVRSQFPSLSQIVNGHPAVFVDGPGGTQVPQRVIDAISNYLAANNANSGGAYATSRNTDCMIAGARAAMGDFLNCDADEIVIGPNMTTLTYAMSRAIGRELGPGDEIVLTLLDHDANFSPWKALEEKGVTIRSVAFNAADCTLDMHDLANKITSRAKLVAVGYASNAVGTINHVAEVVRLAKNAGALSYIDAVHYAPHGPIDVRALDCDFLVCSTYKFFGPHMGVLYGKREHLLRFKPFKVRPLTDSIPNCWEWGTLNHECIAGIKACVDYWEELGRRARPGVTTRRAAILAAHEAIHTHERAMMEKMIAGLLAIPGLKLYGITEPRRFDNRCATIVVRVEDFTPLELATKLGDRGFFTWDGNYYAMNVTEQLDVEKTGGFLRIGLVHYNTMDEVERMLAAVREIVGR